MTNVQLLADTYEMAHGLVKYYNSQLKEIDPYQEWEVNGQKLNSVIWINAHLCWSEHLLVLQALGVKAEVADWLNHYRLGSDGTFHDTSISLKQVLDERKKIHQSAMEAIRALSDEALDEDNALGMQFGDKKSKLVMLQHAIRHEATHAGHLGWLCKLNGINTI